MYLFLIIYYFVSVLLLIPGCRTVFVKNIPYDCNEQTVRDVMTPYGVVKDVRLAVANTSSGSTPRLKGFGYVQFASEVSVNKACAAASAGTLKIGKMTQPYYYSIFQYEK
jgi:nucleolin